MALRVIFCGYHPGMHAPVAVVAYFADDPTRTYQLGQWLPVLEILHERHPVGIVLRDPSSADVLRDLTSLPIFTAPSFPELTALYGSSTPRSSSTATTPCSTSSR